MASGGGAGAGNSATGDAIGACSSCVPKLRGAAAKCGGGSWLAAGLGNSGFPCGAIATRGAAAGGSTGSGADANRAGCGTGEERTVRRSPSIMARRSTTWPSVERILGLAVGLRLAEADVGELALDEIGQAVVALLRLAALLAARERDKRR